MSQTVLIAEDDRALAKLLVRAVEEAGYECKCFADGQAALDEIREGRPDLVLLDILLPRKDGRAVLAEMQASSELSGIPVLVMSGVFRGRATEREFQDAGAEGFLEKPFNTRDLIANVHALIGQPTSEAAAAPAEKVSLADVPAAEVLWGAMREDFTGAVQFQKGKRHKVVLIESGQPRQVRSNAASECLGRRLRRAGRIDDATLQESLRRTKSSSVRQGEVLVELGVITSEEVRAELEAQSEDKLLDLFSWDEGEAWRQPGVQQISYASDLEGWTARLVLLRGALRMDPERVRARLASHAESEVVVDAASLSEAEAGAPGVSEALDAAAGTAVGELLESHACALYGLWLAGAVEIAGAEPGAASAGGGPPQDDMLADLRATRARLEGLTYFELLEVDEQTSKKDVRSAFIKLAKSYHPDRFTGGGEEAGTEASAIFSLMSAAHETLIDTERRRDYMRNLRSGGSERENREELRRIFSAEQKFNEGEALLKQRAYAQALAIFGKTIKLQPDEADFQAHYGWTYYLAKHGETGAAQTARQHLEKAISLAPKSPTGYYFLGQLHKACAQPDLAQRMFAKVLEIRPDHVEASRELRLIQMRKGKGGQSGSGRFGFGRKKK